MDKETRDNLIREYRARYPSCKYRTKCAICKGFKSIVQWHHMPSIKDVVDSGLPVPGWFDWPLIPLCPNHHILVHRLMTKRDDLTNEIECVINTDEERFRYTSIFFTEELAWKSLQA